MSVILRFFFKILLFMPFFLTKSKHIWTQTFGYAGKSTFVLWPNKRVMSIKGMRLSIYVTIRLWDQRAFSVGSGGRHPDVLRVRRGGVRPTLPMRFAGCDRPRVTAKVSATSPHRPSPSHGVGPLIYKLILKVNW